MLLDLRSLYEDTGSASTGTDTPLNPGAGPMWPMLSGLRARPKKKPKKTPFGLVYDYTDDEELLEMFMLDMNDIDIN